MWSGHWRDWTRWVIGTAVLVTGQPVLGDDAPAEPDPIEQSQYSVASPAAAPKPAPAPKPFSPQMFDNNFSYKQDPDHDYILGEELKDMPLGMLTGRPIFDGITVSTGGELRFRYIDEVNRLRPGGPGDSSYDQWRWRHYIDVRASDWIRAYIEMIDGSTNHADLPLQGIDKNRWDLQNYFADIRLPSVTDDPFYFRVGRQELLYGSQRLVSTLDWSNIRRNFEGLKVFTRQDTWDFDAFIVNPVNTATPSQRTVAQLDNSFDTRNSEYLFGGAYISYRGFESNTLDFFFFGSSLDVLTGALPFGERYTIGMRWLGSRPICDGSHVLHAEVEGGYQFGNDRSALYDAGSPRGDVQAGYVTLGVGHTWKSMKWQPSLWWFWDWASGDDDPTDGQNNTFFQYFGFVHAYLGLIDNIARQNISDVNVRWQLKPAEPILLTFAHHWFRLANDNDVLYNVTGTAVGTPGNGTDVGHEFDIMATYTVTPNWSLEAGYFWFWYGDYIDATAPRDDAQQVYIMTTLRY